MLLTIVGAQIVIVNTAVTTPVMTGLILVSCVTLRAQDTTDSFRQTFPTQVRELYDDTKDIMGVHTKH